ncbi:hypothetical protein RN001_003124 [Aquatica leii]|uniref:Uncharacterized protein n=1 Tax=Aquatica leii TaxID=1421715 RepID=A0AAN7PI56_9COLE|nr:hypothetical protein RN001_003124 [Aquatica leii]
MWNKPLTEKSYNKKWKKIINCKSDYKKLYQDNETDWAQDNIKVQDSDNSDLDYIDGDGGDNNLFCTKNSQIDGNAIGGNEMQRLNGLVLEIGCRESEVVAIDILSKDDKTSLKQLSRFIEVIPKVTKIENVKAYKDWDHSGAGDEYTRNK